MDYWEEENLLPDEPEDTTEDDASAEIDRRELSSVENAGMNEVILPGDEVVSGEVTPVAGYIPLMGQPLTDPPAAVPPESAGVEPIDAEQEPKAENAQPWGFWATLGLSLIVAVAFIMLQVFVVMIFFIIELSV